MSLIMNTKRVDDSPEWQAGETTFDVAGKAFVYCLNTGAALDAHEAGEIHENHTCRPARSATDGVLVGVPEVDLGIGKWGWLQIYGPVEELMVAGNCAANVALYTTGTPGTLDDATASQNKIDGVWLTAARGAGAGTAAAVLNFPFYALA